MSAADSFNKINQTGNSSILTYDDIQTRSLDWKLLWKILESL